MEPTEQIGITSISFFMIEWFRLSWALAPELLLLSLVGVPEPQAVMPQSV